MTSLEDMNRCFVSPPLIGVAAAPLASATTPGVVGVALLLRAWARCRLRSASVVPPSGAIPAASRSLSDEPSLAALGTLAVDRRSAEPWPPPALDCSDLTADADEA